MRIKWTWKAECGTGPIRGVNRHFRMFGPKWWLELHRARDLELSGHLHF